jgi:methionyl-tRNA formyltransferase
LRAAFAGTPEFALPALAALDARHSLVGVLTQPDRAAGRGQRLSASPVKQAAQALGAPLAQPASLKCEEGRAALRQWQPDVLVVVAYGLLLPREVLDLPRLGCLNIHGSLLPRWRGAAPVQRALLAGDAETGVSIMQMDAGLDTGAVFLARRVPITAQHTAGYLQAQLAELGALALLEVLDGLAAGTLAATPQPAAGVTYAAKIAKAEARIDWTQDAAAIDRQVRAFNPWPVAETRLAGEQLRIWGAYAVNMPAKEAKSADPGSIIELTREHMLVECGTGVLAVTHVQRPGRRPMSVRDFSHSLALAGRRLG